MFCRCFTGGEELYAAAYREAFDLIFLDIERMALDWQKGSAAIILRYTWYSDGSGMKKYGSLKAMEEGLRGCHFLRIHKSYLVNQEYIKEVGVREVYLTDGTVIEMGRDRKKPDREAMRRYDWVRRAGRFF